MNRGIEHIAALVKYLLDTLTVVHVGIYNGDFCVFLPQMFGDDGGVIKVAKSARRALARMVTRRP